jgi:uncharacterized iron-regulated membrane protein
MAVPLPLFVRRVHKWLALVVGLQALIWTISGMYMVTVHIDYIHGDHLVRAPEQRPFDTHELLAPTAVTSALSGVKGVRLSRLVDRPAYVVETENGSHLFDAKTGAKLSPIDEATVRTMAARLMAEDRKITKVTLLQESPLEVQTRKPPLWRVDFSGWDKPAFYFSPATGEFLSRRHEAWRVFDFMWMLHIMDYDDRQNMNNWLLRPMTWGAALMALTGAWLLWWSFPAKKRQKKVAA